MKKFFLITLWIVGRLVGLVAMLLFSVWIFSGNTPESGIQIAKKGWAQILPIPLTLLIGICC